MAWNPIAEETRRRLQEDDPRWKSKAILRVVATVCAFIAMVLFAVAVAMTLHWADIWNDGIGGDWANGMALAPVCARPCLAVLEPCILPMKCI